jgi:hypothetical protein
MLPHCAVLAIADDPHEREQEGAEQDEGEEDAAVHRN